jgi:flagellar export protein FliJ
MKRFSFPLDRVRRWRVEQAALEELKLGQLRQHLAALGREKQRIAILRTRSAQETLGQPSIGAAELQNLDVYRRHLHARLGDVENRERQAAAEIGQQLQRVLAARRNAELLERLKEKSLAEWQAASDREQENLAGELYLAKRARR